MAVIGAVIWIVAMVLTCVQDRQTRRHQRELDAARAAFEADRSRLAVTVGTRLNLNGEARTLLVTKVDGNNIDTVEFQYSARQH